MQGLSTRRMLGTVDPGGVPEQAVGDGKGMLYV